MDELSKLSCPFTWEMQDVIEKQAKLLETKDDRFEMIVDSQDDFPEFELIYHLMLAYENAMKNDMENTMKSIDKADESFAKIKQRLRATAGNGEKVLQHILDATKCWVFENQGNLTKVNELLGGICGTGNMNKKELAMLEGCQCLAWSLYYATDNNKEVNFAKKASQLEPDNGKWYFLLGKSYRRLRRMHQSLSQVPSKDESSAFEKAYELSKSALFGVTLAQLYRESKNYPMANKLYKEVHARSPTSCKVQLQLALGFIRSKEPMLAKQCLEYVKKKMPDSVMYTHYMGIYEEICNKDFKAALPYYQRTTEKDNFGAEWQYIKCRKYVERNWDPLPYMLALLNRYAKASDHTLQEINIQIGVYYLFKLKDLSNACRYLTQAIQIQPDGRELKKTFPLFYSSKGLNIYEELIQKLGTALKTELQHETKALYNETLQLCHNNYQAPKLEGGKN